MISTKNVWRVIAVRSARLGFARVRRLPRLLGPVNPDPTRAERPRDRTGGPPRAAIASRKISRSHSGFAAGVVERVWRTPDGADADDATQPPGPPPRPARRARLAR